MAPLLAMVSAAVVAQASPPDADLAPAPREALARSSALPAGVVTGLGEGGLAALPPRPGRVELDGYFGKVTLDHPAHVARQLRCRSCHGEGPISRPDLTPRIAHERCRGCHAQLERGPTGCRSCHVLPAPSPGAPALAEAPAAGARDAPSGVPAAEAPPRGGVLAEAADPATPRRSLPFERTVQVGFATAGGGGGPAVLLVSRQGDVLLTEGIERVSGDGAVRTLALAGAGVATPLHPEIDLLVVALGGLDAVEAPSLAVRPALAARFGVRWRPGHRWVLDAIEASFTTLVDLSRGGGAGQARAGSVAAFTTISVGVPLPRR